MVMAAFRTAASVLAVSLWVLLIGPPVLLWTAVSGRRRGLYRTAGFGVRMGLVLAGIRVRVTGAQHILPGAAVYACNHTSNLDAPAVFHALEPAFPRVRVLYKAELRRLPVLVWAFDLAGFVPVERSNRDQSWPAIDRAAQALEDGQCFFIFPEGTRSLSGDLLPFKKGGFVMALKAQAPIVPVHVTGGHAAMRKGSTLIWPATIGVSFLPPVPTAGRTVDDRDRVIAEVRQAIQKQII